jgi:hypothetical protein
MSFANDMLNLRHEIDGLHAARTAMVHRLSRFRANLNKSMARRVAEMRRAFDRECSRARATRHAFAAHNRQKVDEMLGAFNGERATAHRNFLGKRA